MGQSVRKSGLKTVTLPKGAKIKRKKRWIIADTWGTCSLSKQMGDGRWNWNITDQRWKEITAGKILEMPRILSGRNRKDPRVASVRLSRYQDEGMPVPSAPELPHVTPM